MNRKVVTYGKLLDDRVSTQAGRGLESQHGVLALSGCSH